MTQTRAQWLADAPFSLALSAGFFGFFAHTGLLQVLEARGLAPRRVVGVSAGSLAGGLWASGVSAAALDDELSALRRADFWDPGLPLGGVLRGRKFADKLQTLLAGPGVSHFEECATPFAAVVHDVFARRPVVMERGPLVVAIVASCTVPIMFRPVLHEGRVLVDGGVSDRSGLSALPPGERVLLHYLPSRRRTRFGRAPSPPTRLHDRPSMVLVTPELPKVTPFRLEHGPVALRRTREHAQRWLDEPMR
ncbi:MAG: patatin-like phospholipase family protein [Myxococcota bacterium]